MLEGQCPKCGFHRIGLALRNPRNQACPTCGVGLVITDGRRVFIGYSPFTSKRYSTNLSADVSPIANEEDDTRKQ